MKRKQSKTLLITFLSVFALILLSGCATHSAKNITDPPGFFSGLIHGFLIAFNFLLSLFTDYKIYNFPNSGGWYDFGFVIGASMFFGGGGAGACKKKKIGSDKCN